MHFKYRLIIVFSLTLLFIFCWVCNPPVDANEKFTNSAAEGLTGVIKTIDGAFEKENSSDSIITNPVYSRALPLKIKIGAPDRRDITTSAG